MGVGACGVVKGACLIRKENIGDREGGHGGWGYEGLEVVIEI